MYYYKLDNGQFLSSARNLDFPEISKDEYEAKMQNVTKRAEAHEQIYEKSRPLTEAEVSRILITAQINTITVDDNTALRMKSFYPDFDSIVGQTVKQGFKFTHGDKLWKVAQPELLIQANFVPGIGTESLCTEICETHSGSVDDPIPYSGNMALENGKHYMQNGVIYLCNRDTVNPVHNALADLVGLYVEVV